MTNYDAEALYDLVPLVYRNKDAETGYPLRDLVEILAEQAAIVEQDIARMYGDQFIETCEPWAVPYIGDLIGLRALPALGRNGRAEVANMITYRRRKGTAAVLEALARDVTGWPARVVEFFDLLPTTQYMNHLRLFRPRTASIRDAGALDHVDGPFDTAGHTVDVRRVASRRGKYNIPNIGLFVFRIGAFPLELSQPAPLGDPADARYAFNPLGIEAPLLHHPVTETGPSHVAEEVNVPAPIRPRALHADLEAGAGMIYGPGRSVAIMVPTANGWEPVAGLDVQACDLGDLTRPLAVGTVGIDPARGLLAFGNPAQRPPAFRVSSHYGFGAPIGGGQYDRGLGLSVNAEPTAVVGDPTDPIVAQIAAQLPAGVSLFDSLTDALLDAQSAWAAGDHRLVEVLDSRTYTEGLPAVAIPADSRLTIRAANRQRPAVRLLGDFDVAGAAGSSLELDGLLVGDRRISLAGDLNRLVLRHCTLVPGLTLQPDRTPDAPGAVSLMIGTDTVEATISSCILGALLTAPEATVRIEDSVLDAHAAANVAYGGAGGAPFGGPLVITRCTVVGSVRTAELTLGENSIFLGPAVTERRQAGCVRYSWVPAGSRVPRRFHCQPDIAEGTTPAQARVVESRLAPRHTSLTYGHPAYGQLDWRTPAEVGRGADDESEMGVFCALHGPQREEGLRIRLDEFLPVGLEAGVFFAS